jgi:hypothetical protein
MTLTWSLQRAGLDRRVPGLLWLTAHTPLRSNSRPS